MASQLSRAGDGAEEMSGYGPALTALCHSRPAAPGEIGRERLTKVSGAGGVEGSVDDARFFIEATS